MAIYRKYAGVRENEFTAGGGAGLASQIDQSPAVSGSCGSTCTRDVISTGLAKIMGQLPVSDTVGIFSQTAGPTSSS